MFNFDLLFSEYSMSILSRIIHFFEQLKPLQDFLLGSEYSDFNCNLLFSEYSVFNFDLLFSEFPAFNFELLDSEYLMINLIP